MNYQIILFGAISIVGLAEWLKAFDKEDKLKKWYNLLPLLLGIPVGVILTVYQKDPWYMGFLYWGALVSVSVLAYNTIIETINKIAKR